MQLNNIKNDIKSLNKDFVLKSKEISSKVDEKLKDHKTKLFSDRKENTKANEAIFKMPLFDEKSHNIIVSDPKSQEDKNELYYKILSEKILEYEDRLNKVEFDLENFESTQLKQASSFSNGQSPASPTNEQNCSKPGMSFINKLVKDLSNNLQFIDFLKEKIKQENKKCEKVLEQVENNKDDISKQSIDINQLYESILAIRKILNANENSENKQISGEYLKNYYEMQNNFHNLSESTEKKFLENEKLIKKLRDTIEDAVKGLADHNEAGNGNHLRNFFNTLLRNMRLIAEKTDKNTIKLDNFSSEIILKLKKDLIGILYIYFIG